MKIRVVTTFMMVQAVLARGRASYPMNMLTRSLPNRLSFLQAMNRPDLTMAVQQAARFSNNPKHSHDEEAVNPSPRDIVSL